MGNSGTDKIHRAYLDGKEVTPAVKKLPLFRAGNFLLSNFFKKFP